MINIDVKEFEIKLNGESYTFRLDFKALLRFTNKYENAMEIFNEFLTGKNIYECIIKILSCACVEKEITEDELGSKLSFNFTTMKLFDEITVALIKGVLSEENNQGKPGKN